MVTALDQPSDKVQGLEAGADDFLTKPVDDIALITRVKNLARLKVLNDEMMMRAATTQQMGIAGDAGAATGDAPASAAASWWSTIIARSAAAHRRGAGQHPRRVRRARPAGRR